MREIGPSAKKIRKRAGDAFALTRAYRLARDREIIASLDLDRRENAATPRDQIDLADRRTIAPRQDAVALQT